LRDVIGLEIGDGTAEVMKIIVARELMGREACRIERRAADVQDVHLRERPELEDEFERLSGGVVAALHCASVTSWTRATLAQALRRLRRLAVLRL